MTRDASYFPHIHSRGSVLVLIVKDHCLCHVFELYDPLCGNAIKVLTEELALWFTEDLNQLFVGDWDLATMPCLPLAEHGKVSKFGCFPFHVPIYTGLGVCADLLGCYVEVIAATDQVTAVFWSDHQADIA